MIGPVHDAQDARCVDKVRTLAEKITPMGNILSAWQQIGLQKPEDTR